MPKTKRAFVGGILTDEQGGVMVLHRKDAHHSYWEFPGGEVGGDELPSIAIARSIYEQMGVEVRIAEKLGGRTLSENDHECTWFMAEITSGQPRLRQHDSYDKWGYFSLVMLTQRYDELSPGVKSFLEAMAYDEIVLAI